MVLWVTGFNAVLLVTIISVEVVGTMMSIDVAVSSGGSEIVWLDVGSATCVLVLVNDAVLLSVDISGTKEVAGFVTLPDGPAREVLTLDSGSRLLVPVLV